MVVQPGFEAPAPSSQNPHETQAPPAPGIVFASFGARLGALFIDAILSSMLQLAIGWGLALLVTVLTRQLAPGQEALAVFTRVQKYSIWATAIFLTFMNEIVLVALYGGSIGKRLLGLKIKKWNEKTLTASELGWGLAVARYFAKFLSTITFFIGYLMPLWTQHKQTLHDMAVSTVVVEER